MIQCTVCRFAYNRADAKYCSNCGSRLTFLAPGEILQQRYQIVSVLGKGGMGAVCLAEDLQAFGNKCVVKEMIDYFNPSNPAEVQKAQQRFEDEARILAQLRHQSIPDVRHYFSEAGRNYLVMEYVEGENLEERLTREGKPLPSEEVVQYGIRVCRVLEYLSAQKPPLVHHDIKPANIVVSKETDSTSLVDFGTAKMRLVQTGGRLGRGQSSVYGTVGYAPPEQYGDKPKTEPRSDVYALGATLYRLLTNDDPSNHPLKFPQLPALPANIQHVLQRALENDVKRRITAREMREMLEKVLVPETGSPVPVFLPQDKARGIKERAGIWLRFIGFLVLVTLIGSLLSWVGSGLIGQVAVYGFDNELGASLMGLGLVSGLVMALMLGSGLGGPGSFSKLGFLLGLILSMPILGALFLITLAQFCELRTVAGDPLAHLTVAAVGSLIFVLLGLFRGLRKAHHSILAFIVPLLLIAAPAWWAGNDPRAWLEVATYRWPGREIPMLQVRLDRERPTASIEWGSEFLVPYVAVTKASVRGLAVVVEASVSELAPVVPHVWRDLLYPESEPRRPTTTLSSGLPGRSYDCLCPCPFQAPSR